jgi:photosystem II stability/assembly factor-like uncharacterized protein
MIMSPQNPDLLWQQNHCGIFKSTNGGDSWSEAGKKGTLAHFGFAMAVSDTSSDLAWVAPCISDEIRTPIDHSLVICRTDDGGSTWQELRNGLPQTNCFDIVYRHALTSSGDEVIFGTTTGNLFASYNCGDQWETLSNHLPMIHSIEYANL